MGQLNATRPWWVYSTPDPVKLCTASYRVGCRNNPYRCVADITLDQNHQAHNFVWRRDLGWNQFSTGPNTSVNWMDTDDRGIFPVTYVDTSQETVNPLPLVQLSWALTKGYVAGGGK